MSALQLSDLLAKLLPDTQHHHKALVSFLVPGVAGTCKKKMSGLTHLWLKPMWFFKEGRALGDSTPPRPPWPKELLFSESYREWLFKANLCKDIQPSDLHPAQPLRCCAHEWTIIHKRIVFLGFMTKTKHCLVFFHRFSTFRVGLGYHRWFWYSMF